MSDEKKKVYFEPIFTDYQSSTYYDELDLLNNEKSQEKFIFDIERIIRTSLEYRAYIKYLKTEALLSKCTLLDRLPEDVIKGISIEMHHFPFTLYDLVKIVLVKYLKNGTTFTRLSIANEIMDLHYMNEVGIVPLSVTMHQLAHSDSKVINKKNIFGNYKKIIEKYELYLTDEQKNKIVKLEKISDTLILNTINNYLDIDRNLFIELDDSDMDKVHLIEIDNELEDDEEDIEVGDFLKESNKNNLTKVK